MKEKKVLTNEELQQLIKEVSNRIQGKSHTHHKKCNCENKEEKAFKGLIKRKLYDSELKELINSYSKT
jgi:hypothetical protein